MIWLNFCEAQSIFLIEMIIIVSPSGFSRNRLKETKEENRQVPMGMAERSSQATRQEE